MTISHGSYAGDDIPFGRSSFNHRDLDSESGRSVLHAETSAVVLQEIALKCGTLVSLNTFCLLENI
jgi:RNA polymerase II C-terminal domain phosphatase-like 1/2